MKRPKRKTPDSAEARHIKALAIKHSIDISWLSERDTIDKIGAVRASRSVRIPRIIPGETGRYAIALHEIGHVVGPYRRGRLSREIAAWRWAIEHSDRWSRAMSHTLWHGVVSHVRGHAQDTCRIPGARDPVWELLARVTNQTADQVRGRLDRDLTGHVALGRLTRASRRGKIPA